MLISFSHKFIFVRIWKTAGTSLKNVLQQYCPYAPQDGSIRERQKAADIARYCEVKLGSLNWHSPARDIRAALPVAVYNDFFKFAVVRNPWDWMVSWYSFIVQKEDHHYHEMVKNMTFQEFLAWKIEIKTPHLTHFTSDEQGDFIVDHVARMETLSEEFPLLARRMGIRETVLPRLNKSRHRDYRAMYDDAMAQSVAEYFEHDIELFGYTFDGCKDQFNAPRGGVEVAHS